MTVKNPFLLNVRQGKNSIASYFFTLLVLLILVFSTAFIVSVVAILYTGSVDLYNYPPLVLFLINMVIFPVALLSLWFGVRVFHRRKFRSIVTAGLKFSWSSFFLSAALWFVLNIASDAVQGIFLEPGNYAWNFSVMEFLPFAILALIFIPIQSATEELVFRGYFLQGFSSLTRSSIAAVILSSLLFAALHLANPEVSAYGAIIMMLYYLSMGLFLAYLTLRFQGLEAAMGLHIANNLYGVLCVSIPDSALPAPAFFRMIHYDSMAGLLSFFVIAAIFLFLFRKINRNHRAILTVDGEAPLSLEN